MDERKKIVVSDELHAALKRDAAAAGARSIGAFIEARVYGVTGAGVASPTTGITAPVDTADRLRGEGVGVPTRPSTQPEKMEQVPSERVTVPKRECTCGYDPKKDKGHGFFCGRSNA